MGRNKTRKKNQRGGQAVDEQDPDVSEAEPSTSDTSSANLNDAFVLNNSSTVMDTDIEDSDQTTGGLTPGDVDDSEPTSSSDRTEMTPSLDSKIKAGSSEADISNDVDEIKDSPKESCNGLQWDVQWTEEQQPKKVVVVHQDELPPSITCPHVKSSTSMPGIRKALKSEVNAVCASRPCTLESSNENLDGAGDASVSSKELWICLQCGNFGCGDRNAQNGDAEIHFKTPRSDQHCIVFKIGGETDKTWCYTCQTAVDVNHTNLKEPVQFLKRNPKLRLSLQQSKNKTGNTPIIALGPPPPPPQPETETAKSLVINKLKMNHRNKPSSYSSSWDASSRDEWPLGLENLGNTCFMNSALQCLSRTKSLIPKLDLYGTGNVIEILVTADPPAVQVLGALSPDVNGEDVEGSSIFHLDASGDTGLMEENGDSNHVPSSTEAETGGSSPSSSDMDSLLDVASGTSSKSSPNKELSQENYKTEIEKELKKCLRLKLVIPKDSMTSRLRHAFKAMSRSSDTPSGSYSSSEYFGRGRHVFTPSSIHNAMAKHFRLGQQHDSHELLRTVVDMMKKDQIKAFRLAIMQCYGIKKSEGKNCNPNVAELLKMWDRKLYHKTFVDEIFGGELVTFQTCMTCGSVRKSHEDFLDLSLPIRLYSNKNPIPKRTYSIFDDDSDNGARSLEDCLKSFTEAEQLTGSNAVECENCHRMNLEKLAAGASFEEVFPGVKPPVVETKKQPEIVVETEMDAMEPLLMEQESPQVYGNSTEDMDDLDEPAVDGIIGNTSDMEDEGNDVPPLFLGEAEEKGISADFLNSEIPKDNMSLSLAVTQDEGFSESDSSEEKKSASISASSSRNSISEAENGVTVQKKESKPIPITKCPCSRRQMVWTPPDCLTVHLKRFQITSHGTSKLSDRVNFPYILNLTPFCAQHDEDVQTLAGKDFYDEDGEVKYALYGIVEHSGSLHWGHYVAYIKVHGTNSSEEKNNSSESTPDKWFYISDSSVSPSSLESVLGMDPYILFYERIRGQEKKEKLEQLHKLNNPSSSIAYESTVTSFNNDSTTVNYSLD